MSHRTGPPGPQAPPTPRAALAELHGRGSAFGIEYEAGIRVMALTDLGPASSRPPLLPGARRLALPGAGGGS